MFMSCHVIQKGKIGQRLAASTSAAAPILQEVRQSRWDCTGITTAHALAGDFIGQQPKH
jgi:hypothetical protein